MQMASWMGVQHPCDKSAHSLIPRHPSLRYSDHLSVVTGRNPRNDNSLSLTHYLYLYLSYTGDATFDTEKLMDGLSGASKLVRGFADIMDKGTGAVLGLKDRLGPKN